MTMGTRVLLRSAALASAAALLTLAPSAGAQTSGFAVNRFDVSERGSEWFVLESLDIRGHVRPAVGVVGEWGYRPLVIYNGDGSVRASIVRNQIVAHPGASLVLWDRLRLAFDLPIQAFVDGHPGVLNGVTYPPPRNDTALGDLRLGVDARLAGMYGTPFTLAVGAQVSVPTGDVDSYASDGSVRVAAPRLLVAGDVGPFVYAGKLGFEFRSDASFATGTVGSDVFFAAAAGLRVANKKLVIGPEIFGSTVVSDADAFFAKRSTPLEALIGGHYTIGSAFRIGGGIGTGLSRGFGAPVVRGLASLEFVPEYKKPQPPAPLDRDKDGIVDFDDACPDVPGARSDDPSKNGCPVPPDRDKDGVLDGADVCPDLPGIKTDDPKTNGCPSDRDKDGIWDTADACPDAAGVRSTDPKKNGCPPDRDGDGVADKEDACPDTAGVATKDPKTNGCPPDPDRDKDGVLNDADACPDEPGKADPDPKRNGCPKAFVQAGVIKILDQVKFKTGSAEIQPGKDSDEVLYAVQKVLVDHGEIKKVRVEGHTDNKGNAAFNKTLSGKRAASVVKWLTNHGIDKERLTSQGFGMDRPIDSNDTEEGRKNNRRVEFHIEEGAKPEGHER
jgi:outer membrane protein OmpA-like peptidoglycan-associated protein